jgi:predicted flap endonuclease-1-like 5' DNA nuclease
MLLRCRGNAAILAAGARPLPAGLWPRRRALAYNWTLRRQLAMRNALLVPFHPVNGLTLLVVIALAIGITIVYRFGALRGRREAAAELPMREIVGAPSAIRTVADSTPDATTGADPEPSAHELQIGMEKARIIRELAAESAALRGTIAARDAQLGQLSAFAEDRRVLFCDLANARADVARYRDIVVDIETNALPPLLTGPDAYDDLKLIVGVGPVLERMLHRLGVTTYRQIAHWSERDIDEFDAKLPEFPGRIRRDTWVNQARELHVAKFGEPPPAR